MTQPERPIQSRHAATGILIALSLGMLGAFAVRPSPKPQQDPKIVEARRLVASWADKLDRQTTPTGVYERWPNDTLPEADPWGRELAVEYSQGGVAEHVTVRSLGPDGVSRTPDDVVAVRHAVNLKGIGEGVKKNAEETTKNAAKGAVKGIVEGAKEAVKR